jgi:predicted AlkP superfamily pyrophosphatase or phosphodiesterase
MAVLIHNLIDGNDYELTVKVEEEYSNNIYNFYKINDISVVIDYKQNVSNCNNSIVDCSDESRHTCIIVNTSHSSDITVNRSISDSNDITLNRSVCDSNDID